MGFLVVVTVLLMFATTIEETSAACCWSRWGLCGDCTWGTPQCGYYSCNFFGCACGGGCRSGACFSAGRKKRSPGDIDATTVFNVYDLDRFVTFLQLIRSKSVSLYV